MFILASEKLTGNGLDDFFGEELVNKLLARCLVLDCGNVNVV